MIRFITQRLVWIWLIAVVGWLMAPSGRCAPAWVKEAVAVADSITVEEDAPAVMLHLSNDVEISSDGSAKQRISWAVKILTTSGADEALLNVAINDHRKVKDLKGWRIDPNGKEHKLKDEYVVQVALGEASGYYDDDKTLAANFPDVRTGDIVAWQYEVDEKDYWDGFYQSFTFQASLPVVTSHYVITIPDAWQLHISSQNLEPITYTHDHERYEWTSGYLPYRPEEPHMPPWQYVRRAVRVTCYNEQDLRATHFSDWNKVALFATGLHEMLEPPADSIAALADALCAGLTNPIDKLRRIAEYTRDEIRYVAVELGEGRFRPRDALTTCVNRYGDCKDKVALMRALLDAAGINSYPALAMTEGWVDKDFPTPFQFNHVIVAIPLTEIPGYDSTSKSCVDGCLYFDPTNRSTPLGGLPSVLQGTYVLKVSPHDTALTRLPRLAPEDRLSRYRASAELTDGFHLSAQVSIAYFAHRAAEVRLSRMYTPTTDQIESLQRLFSESMQNVKVTNYVTGDDADSVWADFALDGDYSVTQAGNMCLVKADFFHPDRPDDFVKDERIHPIWLGTTHKQITEIDWKIPDGWKLDENTEHIDDSCSAARVTSTVRLEEGTAQFRSVYEQAGFMMPVDEYSQIRAYFRKYRAANKTRAIFIKE